MEEWPLIGRAGDLQTLARWLGDPGCGGGVLVGAAGVGKTRLALEFRQAADEAGYRTEWVVGTRSASALPFGAVASMLPDLGDGLLAQVDNRGDLLRRIVVALRAQARGRRLVVVVDDAHLLDPASAVLALQLAHTDDVFVLVTVRAAEPVPDAITSLWKDAHLPRLDIGGLGSGEVRDLLEAVLGGQVDAGLVTDLATRCDGNVLFLQLLVSGAATAGAIEQRGGVWCRVQALALPERLAELLQDEVSRLAAAERDVLEMVSYGEPLPVEELASLAPAQVLADLERRQWLSTTKESGRLEYRMRHPLYGDLLREQMPTARRRQIARELAEAFVARPRRRDDTLRTAVWQLDGGTRPDPVLLVEAASIARWRYDFELAEALAQSASDHGAGFDARLLLGQLSRLRGDPLRAEHQFADLGAAASSDHDRGQLACARVDNLIMSLGRRTEGIRVAAEAAAAITDGYWRDQLAGRHLGGIMGEEGPRAAIEAIMPVLDRAGGSARVYVAIGASYGLCRMGRIGEALEVAADAYREHSALTEPTDWYPWVHLWARCEALAASGRLEEALALAENQYEIGLGEHSPEARAFFSWSRARTLIVHGRPRAAVQHAREAVLLFRQLGRPNFAGFAAVPLATGLAVLGRAEEAQEVLDDVGSADDQALWNGAERLHAEAWIAVARGDLPSARELLEEAAGHGERIGDLVGATTALHGLVRLGCAARYAAQLARSAVHVEGVLAATQIRHGTAAAVRDPRALLDAAEGFVELGADVLAAECLLEAAAPLRRAGDPRCATAAERRASMLVARCEGARTPALLATGPRGVLTPSERATAVLAAGGKTNREIAAAQHLSIRTVQNRLQTIYAKLNVPGRDDLAEVLDLGDPHP